MKDSHYYLILPCTDDRLFQILCVWKYLYIALYFNWYIFLATEFKFAKNLLQHFFKKVFVLPSSFMDMCGPVCLYVYYMPVHSSYLWKWEKRGIGSLGTIVTGCGELSDVGDGNQSQVLWKSGKLTTTEPSMAAHWVIAVVTSISLYTFFWLALPLITRLSFAGEARVSLCSLCCAGIPR